MTLFMVVAACFGVIQLAVLGWFTGRTVRISTLLLCLVVGLYACGAAALALQYVYTRGMSSITGDPLFQVIRTASYTVDPFIEEFIKVTPLFLLGLSVRIRRQLGMTDYLLLGAALGAGFGLLEAILRFSHRASTAITFIDGWVVPLGLSATYIPDFSSILGSWLPAPATSASLSFATEPDTFVHLAWSAVAGLGVGIILRGRGPLRLLGLLPIIYVSADHAAANYDLTFLGRNDLFDLLAKPFTSTHGLLWLLPLAALAVAGFFDRRDIAKGRTSVPDVLLPNDRATLLAYPFLRPPWTVLIATRFVRARRSLFYSSATTTDAELHSALRRIRAMMQTSSRHAAWSGVKSPPGSLNVARTLADWRLWVWLILALPSIVYFVITDFPGTAGLQTSMETSRLWKPILIALLAGAMLWLLWQVTNLMRQQVDPAAGEARARVRLGLLAGLGGLFVGGYSLLQIFLGTRLDRPPVSTLHVLEALRAALLIVTVLAVVALILTFPPAGLPALAGIGSVGGGAAITISTEMVLGTVIVGGLSTALLMQASGDGGGSSGPTGPEREGIRLDRSGKVHTPPGQRLPDHVPSHWTRAELRELADDLRTSIANRKAEALRLGEEGGHRARIADEEQLLRQIENVLSGS